MLHCKSCDDWFHGGCVKYKCTQCSNKDEKGKQERNQKTKEENKLLKEEKDVFKREKKDMEKKINELKHTLSAIEKDRHEAKKIQGKDARFDKQKQRNSGKGSGRSC